MLTKIRSLSQLNRIELLLTIYATILSVIIALSLKLFGYNRTQQLLLKIKLPIKQAPQDDTLEQAKHSEKLTRRVFNNLPFHCSCLVRSLVLQQILKSQNLIGELHIGVPQNKALSEQFQAHMWVEYQGVVLNDRQDITSIYKKLYSSS